MEGAPCKEFVKSAIVFFPPFFGIPSHVGQITLVYSHLYAYEQNEQLGLPTE